MSALRTVAATIQSRLYCIKRAPILALCTHFNNDVRLLHRKRKTAVPYDHEFKKQGNWKKPLSPVQEKLDGRKTGLTEVLEIWQEHTSNNERSQEDSSSTDDFEVLLDVERQILDSDVPDHIRILDFQVVMLRLIKSNQIKSKNLYLKSVCIYNK